MSTLRVGLISDTHVPEVLPEFPSAISEIFHGVNLIIHAGDVTGSIVLEKLSSIAPVIAVKGDHDKLNLPEKKVVEIGGKKIGIFHGNRFFVREIPSTIFNELMVGQKFSWGGFQNYAIRSFHEVDMIVFGHFHRPYLQKLNGTLLFSPGAIYHITSRTAELELEKPSNFIRRIYLNRRIRKPINPPISTVGILTINNGTIQANHFRVPSD